MDVTSERNLIAFTCLRCAGCEMAIARVVDVMRRGARNERFAYKSGWELRMSLGRTRYRKGRRCGAPDCRCRELATGVSSGEGARASPESRGVREVRCEYISVPVAVVILHLECVARAYVNG